MGQIITYYFLPVTANIFHGTYKIFHVKCFDKGYISLLTKQPIEI